MCFHDGKPGSCLSRPDRSCANVPDRGPAKYFYRLKLVADATPNADGRWITVVVPRAAPGRYWQSVTEFFHSCIPRGEHLVQYERVDA